MKKLLPLLVMILAASAPAWAWGCKGHQVVALIAYRHLDPAVARQVDEILAADPYTAQGGRGCGLAGIPAMAAQASWADEQRSQLPGSAPWHYIDIPLGAVRAGFDLPKLCNDDCVTWSITHFNQQLKTATDAKDRADALRFVVHFVGDIHQPLHGVDNADEGGNCVHVHYLDAASNTSLHSIWDSGIITTISGAVSAQDWATQLDNGRASAGSSNPEDWAWESHDAALKYVYGPLPSPIAPDPEPPVKSCADRKEPLPVEDLEQPYVDQATPEIELRLDQAGLRLARMLNQTLGSSK